MNYIIYIIYSAIHCQWVLERLQKILPLTFSQLKFILKLLYKEIVSGGNNCRRLAEGHVRERT